MTDIEAMKKKFLAAILELLDSSKITFDAIPKMGGKILSVTGISLDIYPWNEYFALSLRNTEKTHNQHRYSPAEWNYFEFATSLQSLSQPLVEAVALMTTEYDAATDAGLDSTEASHLMFIAGAEALLDPAVAKKLRTYGIEAPLIDDSFANFPFEYMVFDSDSAALTNYCELVIANRVTLKLLRKK